MDGKAGPGGGGLDPNSSYDTYALWGLNGGLIEDYGVGLGSIGSVGLVAVKEGPLEGSRRPFSWMRGPGLNNDILLNVQKAGTFQYLQRSSSFYAPSVQHFQDDDLTNCYFVR